MKKPDKNLFEYDDTGGNKPRTYRFTKFDGTEGSYVLGRTERLWKKCSICGNYIVAGYEYMDKWMRCPCCKINTSEITIEEYKKIIEDDYKQHVKQQDALTKTIIEESAIIQALEIKIKSSKNKKK